MKKITLLLLALAALVQAEAAKPRLVVQVVVGSMRAGDLERYAANYGDGGLRRLMQGGVCFAEAGYDCLQTTSPVSLATLATGAEAATHGVVGEQWMDYTTNSPVFLTEGRRGEGPYQLVAPTLGETLSEQQAESQVVTLALDATSAVMLGGHTQHVYWLDKSHCGWATSPYYGALPNWMERSNREKYNLSYVVPWQTCYDATRYRNTRRWDVALLGSRRNADTATPRLKYASDYDRFCYTPAGNAVLLSMAKQLVAQFKLGADEKTDLLNISLDPSRYIMETYGPESMEVEDMYYRLDRELADFLTYLFAQVQPEDVLLVLTAAHGSSASYDATTPERPRFNNRQFEVIANGFLNIRYGTGYWVTACHHRTLYLNHNLIYERGLNLADVQNEVAVFAMQFEGVSHALAATAMRTSYFGSGYARKMQQSFYPRRSGDVVFNLMPGWIEERDGVVSTSGSMYGYDSHVPLIFYGCGLEAATVRRPVEMTSVAATLARCMAIDCPAAAEGEPLAELDF